MTKLICLLSTISIFFFLNPDTHLIDKLPAEAPGRIEFIGDAGSQNVFTIQKWGFTKIENAHQPENILVEAILDMRSISCDWKDLEKGVKKKKDYFFTRKFPQATIAINGATLQADSTYHTMASVTIKNSTKKVPLVFSISATAPYSVQATGTIHRSLFKFTGNGPKEEVPIKVDAILE